MMNYKPTILVADDSETFTMYVSILLRRMSFDVIPTENGLDALKLSMKMRPDVVMLDIDMPQMDGITVLRHMKEDTNTSNIPVIMCSVHSDEKTLTECSRLSCSGYLTKPIKVTKLHNTLHDCITFSEGKKRKYLRTTYNKKVSVTCEGITSEHFAVSLSEGGIYIRKRDPYPEGTELEVSLPLDDEHPVSLGGKVIYTKGIYGDAFNIDPGMAIEFQELTVDHKLMLSRYITDQLTMDIPAGYN